MTKIREQLGKFCLILSLRKTCHGMDLCTNFDKVKSGMMADSQQQIRHLVRAMERSLEAFIYVQQGHTRYRLLCACRIMLKWFKPQKQPCSLTASFLGHTSNATVTNGLNCA